MRDNSIVFVLGAGFSVAKGFPLMRKGSNGDLADRVVHFMLAERHPSYAVHLCANDVWDSGQFFAGLDKIDAERRFGFEELMDKLRNEAGRSANAFDCPEAVTYKKLKIGCERFFWCLQRRSYHQGAYEAFARQLGDFTRNGTAVTVISLNWDLLIEEALTAVQVAWRYELGDSRSIAILKPHGSINWLRRGGPIFRRVLPAANVYFDPHDSLVDPLQGQEALAQRWVIYPHDPETSHDAALIRVQAASALAACSRVVFIGYSLPRYDMEAEQLFREHIANPAIEVHDLDQSTLNRYKEIWPQVAGSLTAFTGCKYAALSGWRASRL
jgi:hypothetical protein